MALLALLFVASWTTGAIEAPTADGRQQAIAAPAKHIICRGGAKRVLIGGYVRCLSVGHRCDVSFNTTKPSYRRYGFLCSSWYTGAPTRLFRIAQPAAAPTTCSDIRATPSSAHLGSESEWIGDSPLWLGPYLDWRSSAVSATLTTARIVQSQATWHFTGAGTCEWC